MPSSCSLSATTNLASIVRKTLKNPSGVERGTFLRCCVCPDSSDITVRFAIKYWEGTSERFIGTLKAELVSMRRTAQYFGKKMTNLFKKNVLEWVNDRLFASNTINKVQARKNRMYY